MQSSMSSAGFGSVSFTVSISDFGLVDRNPCRVWSRCPNDVATGLGLCLRIVAADMPGIEIKPLSIAAVSVDNAGDPNAPCQKAATSACVLV